MRFSKKHTLISLPKLKLEVIAIHIGYPKSASTTLQKHLFSKHPDINSFSSYPTKNIGVDSSEIDYSARYLSNDNLKNFYQRLSNETSSDFDHQAISSLTADFKKDFSTSQCNLFSSEFFTSVFFSNKNLEEKANRLSDVFPDAKIVVIVRNQLDIIKSQYKDHPFDPRNLTSGKPLSLNEFIAHLLDFDHEIKYLDSLRYFEKANIYEQLFSANNICVLCMEDLKHDLRSFSSKVSDFLHIDSKSTEELLTHRHENRGVGSRYNTYRKMVRNYYPAKVLHFMLANVFKIDVKKILTNSSSKVEDISLQNINRLTEYFGKSNFKLANKYAIDVVKYQYPHKEK